LSALGNAAGADQTDSDRQMGVGEVGDQEVSEVVAGVLVWAGIAVIPDSTGFRPAFHLIQGGIWPYVWIVWDTLLSAHSALSES
jgi:hypothetical protein